MKRAASETERVISWRSPWGALPVLLINGRIRAIALDPRAAPSAPATRDQRPLGPIHTAADVTRLMNRALRGSVTAREITAACDLSGSTEFERKVFAALAKVRRGGVISYHRALRVLLVRHSARIRSQSCSPAIAWWRQTALVDTEDLRKEGGVPPARIRSRSSARSSRAKGCSFADRLRV